MTIQRIVRALILVTHIVMRYIFVVILVTSSLTGFCQNGYIQLLDGDSVLTGFVRRVTDKSHGEALEFWKTKYDKNPRRILKDDIHEYAVKKDTFRILHNFQPFADEGVYFERVEAAVRHGKRINVMLVFYTNPDAVSTYTGGGLLFGAIDAVNKNYPYIYLLEDSSGGLPRAIPSKGEEYMDALKEFFPARYLERYAEENGPIKYKNIPKVAELFNSK